ncbi:MAG: hypothetical protein A2020_11840 [Lentisphaerae bacterium GWF2_45_14]|nr:MAG: hypothetical protein A2020_11840 [Lentisphaerae bacterium GWF2_45_14]
MKEHNGTVVTSKCPGREAVSAFLDGELPPESTDAVHIRSCPECLALLESYRLADTAMKDALAASVPENINARIKRRVHAKIYVEEQKEARRSVSSIFFPSFVFRMAAGLLFCAAVVLYTVYPWSARKSHGKNNRPLIAENSSTMELKNGVPGAVSFNDFAPVSFKEPKKPFTQSPAGPEQGAVIPENLTQVWLVSDTASAEAVLKEIVSKAGIEKVDYSPGPDGDVLKAHFELTKLQLVKLVKSCGASGFKLLSPSAPQPEQNVFVGLPSDKINYEASFVVGGD